MAVYRKPILTDAQSLTLLSRVHDPEQLLI
jgi:hypothetical protein